jgi:hypothetical protein
MSIYVLVWADDQVLYCKDVCSNIHFLEMRRAIHKSLEEEKYGGRFPILLKTPISQVSFSVQEVRELKKEAEIVIEEKNRLVFSPRYKHSASTVGFVVNALEAILNGCVSSMQSDGEMSWDYDIFDEDYGKALVEEILMTLRKSENEIKIESVPFDDSQTYDLLISGDTEGVFLFEYSKMKEVLLRIVPSEFIDLVLTVVLYWKTLVGNPWVEEFVERRDKKGPIEYRFPQLKEVLDETYGFILYHDQIVKVLQTTGGLPPDRAEIIRKGMGESDPEAVSRFQEEFVKGLMVVFNGTPEIEARKFFEILRFYAKTTLRRGYAETLAKLAYQTAYLKAHYRGDFEIALQTLRKVVADPGDW